MPVFLFFPVLELNCMEINLNLLAIQSKDEMDLKNPVKAAPLVYFLLFYKKGLSPNTRFAPFSFPQYCGEKNGIKSAFGDSPKKLIP